MRPRSTTCRARSRSRASARPRTRRRRVVPPARSRPRRPSAPSPTRGWSRPTSTVSPSRARSPTSTSPRSTSISAPTTRSGRRRGAAAWPGPRPLPTSPPGAIAERKARHVLNVFAVAWATQRGSMTGGPGEVHAAQSLKQNLEVPFGWFPQPVYFATIMRRHMIEFGTTAEQFGAVALACRRHANLNPAAVMHGRPMAMADYLAAPMLADPLRLLDSCLISDGGAAYVTTSVERARDLRRDPVVVAGVGEGYSGSGTHWALQRAFTSTPQVFSAPGAFAMAGLTPGRRRRAHGVRPVHRRVAHADRRHGLLPEGRGRRVRRGRHAAPRRRTTAVQHARRSALARLRARHRARRRSREAVARRRGRAGARLRGRRLRRLHRPHGEHARA